MKMRIKVESKVNFFAPKSAISVRIEPNKWLILYMTEKIVLGKPWGEFTIDWELKRRGNREDGGQIQELSELMACIFDSKS